MTFVSQTLVFSLGLRPSHQWAACNSVAIMFSPSNRVPPTSSSLRAPPRMLRAALAVGWTAFRCARPGGQLRLHVTRSSASQAAPATLTSSLHTLESLPWDHSFIRELPGDKDTRNEVRQVVDALYTRVSPTPPAGEPRLLAYSTQVCELLGLDPLECERPEFPLLFSGAAPLPGAAPYAQCYGGHQFGQWAGQLGDGRAMTLGEVVVGSRGTAGDTAGRRWELQLKGAGKTPYSRRADGRAVLRSSVREFVASEAMAALGVPTTRALSLVATGEPVLRDMFYNGNAKYEPGAVVCRVAPSFVRFGTFQLPASRGGGQEALCRMLADYIIAHHYPHLLTDFPIDPETGVRSNDMYTALLREVCERTGALVAAWQSVGFVHGVLNSDNMSILGLTIDYGPYGFLDRFDPYFTPNLTDLDGKRYCFRGQPEAAQFNLVMLANALLAADLVDKSPAEEALATFSLVLTQEYERRMAAKLGLAQYDKTLSGELMKLMYEDDADFTNTFRSLSTISSADESTDLPAALRAAIGSQEFSDERQQAWSSWLASYKAKLRAEGVPDAVRQTQQNQVNPKFIPRQHLLQYAIEQAEQGDTSELDRLMDVVTRPFDEQPDADPQYSSPPPTNMIRPGVTCLSCSS